MNVLSWLALLSYATTFLIIFVFALTYLRRTEFMPYHGVAVGQPWRDIEPRLQLLLLALLKVIGAAWLAVALAGVLLLYMLFSHAVASWQLWIFQVFCLSAMFPPVAVATYVKLKTAAPTPIASGVLAVMLSMCGFIFALLSGRFS